MNNFKPGGLRNRKEFLGGRPKSDANYGPKKRFDAKPQRSNDRGERKEMQLFQTTCTTCGKSCEVPFRPDGTKPVLCRDCFSKKNEGGNGSFEKRERFSPSDRPQRKPERDFGGERPARPQAPAGVDYSNLVKQITTLETKVNQILELLSNQNKAQVSTSDVAVEAAPTKVRKPKKEVTKKVVKKAVKKAAKKTK